MTSDPAAVYSALLPPQNSSQVTYYVEAYDYLGNLALENNNGQYYIYGVSDSILILVILVPLALILVVSTFLVLRHAKDPSKDGTQTRTKDLFVQDTERNL
jgi:hypothetical protein